MIFFPTQPIFIAHTLRVILTSLRHCVHCTKQDLDAIPLRGHLQWNVRNYIAQCVLALIKSQQNTN